MGPEPLLVALVDSPFLGMKVLQSWRTTFGSCGLAVRCCIDEKPGVLNRFIKKLTRERVVPIISAGISPG